jgi:hypothetical protein
MPVAFARKIEWVLHDEQLTDLDIQLEPIALTAEQVQQYHLPSTPSKDKKRGKGRFADATELDALEALHPGELANIIERAILRYYDADLHDRINGVTHQVEDDIADVNARILRAHRKDVAKLKAEHKKLVTTITAAKQRMRPVIERIERALRDANIDVTDYDWPEPAEPDAYADALYDSNRDYIEQLDRYKQHQDKPTSFRQIDATCVICGEGFIARRTTAHVCRKKECRRQYRREGRYRTLTRNSAPHPVSSPRPRRAASRKESKDG